MNSARRTCKAWICRNLFHGGTRGRLRERHAGWCRQCAGNGATAMVLYSYVC